MKFVVTIEQDEEGWYVVECPALPGCVSQGKTRAEAIANIREAIEVSLETRKARGLGTVDVVEVEVPSAS
jgi:predicted RNase H-like HicB family nuclease